MNFPPLISANRNQWGPLGGLFHAQQEGIAETKRIPAAGLLKELLCRNFRRGDFGCPEGIRGNTEQKAGTPVWNKKEKMIFVRFLL